MTRKYTCQGEYKGQSYKIVSVNIGSITESEYGAVVEINGIRRHARIGTHKTVAENVQDAITAAKRMIDSTLEVTT